MAKLIQRYLAVCVALLAVGGIVSALQYTPARDEAAALRTIRSLPLRIGSWQGYDLDLNAQVYALLETRAIVHRNYVAPNRAQVLLSIVHYGDTKVDFHAPESCLGGRGERTTKSVRKVTVPQAGRQVDLEVAEILSRNDNGRSLSLYFYRTGGFNGQEYIAMRLRIAFNRLTARDSSGSLVRLSTDIVQDEEASRHVLEAFLRDLFPVLDSTL